MVSWRIAGLLACLVVAAAALPADPQPGPEARNLHSRNTIQTENDLMESIYADCLRKDSMSCVKYKLFTFVDKMLTQKDTFQLTEGVTVAKTANADTSDGAPRTISSDDTVESLIVSRVQRFLETHTLKVDLKGSDVVNAITSTGRAIEDLSDSLTEDDSAIGEESRGKKKKAQKILGPLFAALAMKAAALIPLALGAIALIAGKALLVGKIALVLSAIIGLKKLFSGHGKHVTYEVVSHPHHSSSHVSSHDSYGGGYGGGDIGGGGGGYSGSSGHGGWARSLDGQELAYRGHIQQQQ